MLIVSLSLLFSSTTSFGERSACPQLLQILSGEHTWLLVRRTEQGRSRQETGAVSITPENIRSVFRHQYDGAHPEVFGAKGLTYIDSRGELHVIFWATGIGRGSSEVHHRDALSELVTRDAAVMELQANRLFDSGREVEALTLVEQAARYRTMSRNLSNIRTQADMPAEILARVQGFQFSAREVNRGGVSTFQVTRLEVGSSPTSIQVARRAYLDPGVHARMVAAIHGAIAPSLQGYRNVLVQGLTQMETDSPETYRNFVRNLARQGLRAQDLEDSSGAR